MIFQALSVKTNADTENTGVHTRLLGRHNDWFVPGLYKNEMRRTWSMGLLFAIVLFFALPVVNLLVFSNSANSFEEYPERALSYLQEYFAVSNPLITVFAALGGMFCAMVVAVYLYDRRKMNFICSLPVKRQAYLITKAAANLTWSVLAWLPATVLMVLVALLTETMRPHLGLVFGGCFLLMAAWLCMHLYFFGLTLLACSFCGTGVMGGCMLLMLGGYIPVAALSLIGLAGMTVSNLDADYYLSTEFFSVISGVFRIFARIGSQKSVWFLLGCALIGLILCAAAVLLTVIRKSEKAGTPFAFDRVRDLVKYLLMGLASLLGGMLFEAMSSGADAFTVVWMLFGCVCGAVLCWMLCNTIFFKTPRMMFVGRRGLIILTACMMVFSVCARLDVLNLYGYVPSNVMTRQVVLDNRDMAFTVGDKSLVRMFNAMAKNGQALYDKYGPGFRYRYPGDRWAFDEEKFNTEGPTLIDIGTVVWKTHYLLPLAKRTYVTYDDWAQFVTALTSRENFADLYFEDLLRALDRSERAAPGETNYLRVNTNDGILPNTGMSASAHVTPDTLRTILLAYREEMRAFGADAMQQIFVGTMYFRLDSGYYELPLFAPYEKTLDTVRREMSTIAGFDLNDFTYEKTFRRAVVYYRGQVIDYPSEAEVEDMLASGILSGRYSTYETPMTLIEPDYSIEITYQIRETNKYTYVEYVDGDTDVIYSDMPEGIGDVYALEPTPKTETSYNEYENTVSVCFYRGSLPEKYAK